MKYLKDMINKFDLMNLYKIVNINIVEYIFLSVFWTVIIINYRIDWVGCNKF